MVNDAMMLAYCHNILSVHCTLNETLSHGDAGMAQWSECSGQRTRLPPLSSMDAE